MAKDQQESVGDDDGYCLFSRLAISFAATRQHSAAVSALALSKMMF